MNPLVSVVLPLYNASSHIKAAVESILNQSYLNFELIIIDDCSTDGSYDIVNSIEDSRIRLIKNQNNQGLARTLNFGVSQARGKYLARMDHDDISLVNRLSEQVKFLEDNSNCILVGCNCDIIDNSGTIFGNAKIQQFDDSYLKAILFFACPFVHPSIMIRVSIFNENLINYSIEVKQAEDYVLYCAIMNFGKFFILPQKLFQYREHVSIDRGTSPKNKEAIYDGRVVAWKVILDALQVEYPSANIFSIHDKLTYYPDLLTLEEIQQVGFYFEFLTILQKKNTELKVFNDTLFSKNICSRIYSTLALKNISISLVVQFFFKFRYLLSFKEQFKLVAKLFKRIIENKLKLSF